jgi:hypothetical protein
MKNQEERNYSVRISKIRIEEILWSQLVYLLIFSVFFFLFVFMIGLRSVINIVDKTGGTKGLCIKVLRNKSFALMGDIFLLSIRSRSARIASLLK